MLFFDDIPEDYTTVVGTWRLTADDIVAFAHVWDPQPVHVDAEAAAHAEILTTNILNLDKQRTYVLLVEIQHLGEFLLAPVWYVFQMTAIFLVCGMPGNMFVLS